MLLDVWDVRLEISVVSTLVNLNGPEFAPEKQENGKSGSTLVLIDSPQWRKCAEEQNKHRQLMEFGHSHLTHNIFDYLCGVSFLA